MAETATSTSAPIAHAPDKTTRISDLGVEIGDLMRRIIYLVDAAEGASDSVICYDEAVRDALNRVLVFLSLIQEAATKAEAIGLAVEASGNQSQGA